MEERIADCIVTFDGIEIQSCQVGFDSDRRLEICAPSDLPEDQANKLKTLPDGARGTFEITVKKAGFFSLTFDKCTSLGTEMESQSERVQFFVAGSNRYLLCAKIRFLTR